MYGKGLIKGLAVTGKASVKKRLTEKYPEVKPVLPKCWRGDLQMDVNRCIACGLCARACPNHAITLEIGKAEDNKKKMLKYELNRSYCLHCGLCVEACPTHCLKFTLQFETALFNKENVMHDLLKHPNLEAVSSTFGQVAPAVAQAAPETAPAAKAAAEAAAAKETAAAQSEAENTPVKEAVAQQSEAAAASTEQAQSDRGEETKQ